MGPEPPPTVPACSALHPFPGVEVEMAEEWPPHHPPTPHSAPQPLGTGPSLQTFATFQGVQHFFGSEAVVALHRCCFIPIE